jgi:hypothetical protein
MAPDLGQLVHTSTNPEERADSVCFRIVCFEHADRPWSELMLMLRSDT